LRNKIITVNAIIVLIVGLLAWVIVRQGISSAASNSSALLTNAKHEVTGAAARLQLDGLRAERWLGPKAADAADVFGKSTDAARKDGATTFCDRLIADARTSPAFEGIAPAVAMLIDANGKAVARNGSGLNSGRDVGADYPSFKEALAKEHSGSDIWTNKDRQDSYVASYAPVRGADGHVVGMAMIGVTLADELLRVSDQTTGRALALAMPDNGGVSIVAHSTNATQLDDDVTGAAKDLIKRVVDGGKSDAMPVSDMIVAAAPLDGLGAGKGAIVAAAPSSLIDNATAHATPILFVTGLGILLVIIGGWLLGNYITRPINMLEEGLLAILNGAQDKRFELDHPELGGLAFRIDQLLNQLMGVEEDTTDEEGRVSKAPDVRDFRDAMNVDRSQAGVGASGAPGASEVDPAVAAQLASEPATSYYARIYGEYINAKKALGEKTDHITEQVFSERIQGMEKDATAKYGRPVRYQVKSSANGKEVVLLPVLLPS
jgi:hypothetical protein